MTRKEYIAERKAKLAATDYIAIKASEGIILEEKYGDWRAERQSIRDEINRINEMTDEEYYEAYPDEVEEKGGEDARTARDSE